MIYTLCNNNKSINIYMKDIIDSFPTTKDIESSIRDHNQEVFINFS